MAGTRVGLFSGIAEVSCDNGNCSAATLLMVSLTDGAGSCPMVSWRLCSLFLLFLGRCSLRACFPASS